MTIVLKCCEASKKKDESLNLKTDAKVKDEPNTEHMKIDHDQHSNDITSEPILETPVTTTEQDTDANDIQSEGDQHTNGKQSEPNHDTNGNQSKPDHDTIGIQSALDQETNDIAPGPEQDPKVMTSNNNHDMNDIESETDNRSFAIRHWKIIAIAFGLVSAAVFVALIVVYVTDKSDSSPTLTDGLIKAETNPTSTTISLQTTTTETTTIMQRGRAMTDWIISTIVCGTAVLIYISVFIYCLCRTRESKRKEQRFTLNTQL
ncbi:uncharacterized protein LOC128221740 [Mya arenaria]|uniref:uncharacterized protein LOC128221740 n=1 Tax=Mya arenaria TaxID=6604 RepID=UPI0022E2AE1E|nr:uncharacterized protein LOC128221740 [Mya arenaria]